MPFAQFNRPRNTEIQVQASHFEILALLISMMLLIIPLGWLVSIYVADSIVKGNTKQRVRKIRKGLKFVGVQTTRHVMGPKQEGLQSAQTTDGHGQQAIKEIGGLFGGHKAVRFVEEAGGAVMPPSSFLGVDGANDSKIAKPSAGRQEERRRKSSRQFGGKVTGRSKKTVDGSEGLVMSGPEMEGSMEGFGDKTRLLRGAEEEPLPSAEGTHSTDEPPPYEDGRGSVGVCNRGVKGMKSCYCCYANKGGYIALES
jgi:hypothetical protein